METIKTKKQMKEEVANHNTVARSVNRFTKVMKLKLMMNLHKGHWSTLSETTLEDHILRALGTLGSSIESEKSPEEVTKNAADIANYAMMIAENYKTEYLKQQRKEAESNEN